MSENCNNAQDINGLCDDIEKFGYLLADLAKSIGYKFENPDLERMKEKINVKYN